MIILGILPFEIQKSTGKNYKQKSKQEKKTNNKTKETQNKKHKDYLHKKIDDGNRQDHDQKDWSSVADNNNGSKYLKNNKIPDNN